MTYQITYETADGTVEAFAATATKAKAIRLARDCAKHSAINEPLNVQRWFAENDEMTVATFPVAA